MEAHNCWTPPCQAPTSAQPDVPRAGRSHVARWAEPIPPPTRARRDSGSTLQPCLKIKRTPPRLTGLAAAKSSTKSPCPSPSLSEGPTTGFWSPPATLPLHIPLLGDAGVRQTDGHRGKEADGQTGRSYG